MTVFSLDLQWAGLVSCRTRGKVVCRKGTEREFFTVRRVSGRIRSALSTCTVQTYFFLATRFALLTGGPTLDNVDTYSWVGICIPTSGRGETG
jgi:hypothetical protein